MLYSTLTECITSIIRHTCYMYNLYIVLCEPDPALLAVRQPGDTAHALPRLVRVDFTLATYIICVYLCMHITIIHQLCCV